MTLATTTHSDLARTADVPMVTSSDLVRHFGIWQERAARAPVYVLHRGRPRFVLTSIDVMDALCAPHTGGDAGSIDAALLLDGVRDLVVLADANLRIIAASRTARAYFGTRAAPGGAVDAIAADASRSFLAESLRRVAESSRAETIELASSRHATRQLAVTIEPHGGGVVLFADDATAASELRDATAWHDAAAASLAVLPGTATAQLNLRGYLEHPATALASLTGLTPEALASVRFVSLIEIAGRVAVAEAIEAVIASGTSHALDARLLVNRAAPAPIRLGFAAIRRGAAVEGVVVTLVRAS